MSEGYSPMEGGGLQRTTMHCHNCDRTFVAELDLDISGEHVICCPHCGHEHWRKIEGGKITEARWGRGDSGSQAVSKATTWKSSVLKAETSTVSHYIRERWLNRTDFNGW